MDVDKPHSFNLRIIRAEPDGTKKEVTIPLTGIMEVMPMADIFTLEYTLNLIPHMRFHIEQVD